MTHRAQYVATADLTSESRLVVVLGIEVGVEQCPTAGYSQLEIFQPCFV